MNIPLIVLDHNEQWQPYYPSDCIITVGKYLQSSELGKVSHTIINLCHDLSYRSEGYYCSLLAAARGHRSLPDVETLNKLRNYGSIQFDAHLLKNLERWVQEQGETPKDNYTFKLFFGKTPHARLQPLFRRIYENYPAPILEVRCVKFKIWSIESVKIGELDTLSDAEQTLFADTLDHFSRKIWRKPRNPKSYRYELAILVDPEEKTPPSSRGALKQFIQQAKHLGIAAELITAEDIPRLMEYDALFIRMTTALNNVTYKTAQLAEQSGLAVIDDPTSIVRCTNKVYLDELLRKKGVPMPKSRLLFANNCPTYAELSAELGETLVLKVPDGAFSIGVSKVSDANAYSEKTTALFAETAVIIAQEYVKTDFDWRIGILNGEPLYACKYFMARGHWQIYNHEKDAKSKTGSFETLSVHAVPRIVLKTALKAANLIGKGLYGVDLKQTDEQHCLVIEVNDNPSIDQGVEDNILGDVLYRRIMDDFLRRLERKRYPL